MFTKLLAGLFILFLFIPQTANVFAIAEGDECNPKDLKLPRHSCDEPFFCIPLLADADRGSCGELIAEGDECNPKAINPGCDDPLFCKPTFDDPDRGSCEVFPIPEGDICNPNDSMGNHGCEKSLLCVPTLADADKASCEVPITEGDECNPKAKNPGCAKSGIIAKTSLFCKPTEADPDRGSCEVDTNRVSRLFGKIEPPPLLKGFLAKNPTGASAISQFLSNFVSLLFTIAMIALIFMILWAAFDWLTSGGDKEKLAAAQRRLLHAFIGILLFAVAFAIIRVLGTFTGFSFFAGT